MKPKEQTKPPKVRCNEPGCHRVHKFFLHQCRLHPESAEFRHGCPLHANRCKKCQAAAPALSSHA